MSEIQHHTPMAQLDPLFVDCETTGLEANVHEIIDLAAVRMSHDLRVERGVVSVRCRLTRPDVATPEALEINGYNARDWTDAVPIRLALIDFDTLIGDGKVIWVGHNPSFDRDFIREAHARESLVMPHTKYLIDTASMAWPLCVRGILERVNLESLCARYNVSNAGQHRALADVRRTIAVYRRMLGMRPTEVAP